MACLARQVGLPLTLKNQFVYLIALTVTHMLREVLHKPYIVEQNPRKSYG
jgi:hypothetical protein